LTKRRLAVNLSQFIKGDPTMSFAIFAAPLLFLALDVVQEATPLPLRSSDNRQWTVQYNEHGAVLRSGRDTVYLGDDCDALSRTWGRGRWEYANGGFLILIGRRRIGFPRQAIAVGRRCLAQ
jgi:hypothetical protein